MKKFGMLPKIRHVVLVASDMKKKHKDLLRKWLGKEQVIVVDKNHIQDKVPGGV
jgi:gluconate kinase